MISKHTARLAEALLRRHKIAIVFIHVVLSVSSLFLAWLLRFDFTVPHRGLLLATTPVLVLVRLVTMARFRLLHGNWRYTGVYDAPEIAKAVGAGSLAFFLTIRFILHINAFPLSIYATEGALFASLLGGIRLSFRVLAEAASQTPPGQARKPMIIVGAGFAAQMIIRELRQAQSLHWVVGCVDDDPAKVGKKVQGKPVLGTVDQLPHIAVREEVQDVLIAVPSANGAQMRRFVRICETAGLRSATVPALHDLISGRCKISDLHDVNLDDLLGREPVDVDSMLVSGVVNGKVVLVTGAAGSIGTELCRQIMRYFPAKLICVDQNETGLFYLQMELANHAKGNIVAYCVADYGDSSRMAHIFSRHRAEVVFHAAAYKHVPMMEENAREALHNNVFGLRRLLEVAKKHHCENFVLISSDKAVNPSSVMGCTKRICELTVAAFPSEYMKCVSVRFGNVLGSQGSVVPVFQRQLSEKQRITITHPEISRFFMTIREAVSLVLQAAAVGDNGDILVLDMGDPIRIVDLARTLIRLSGKSEKDVEIVFTGLRPGEKLYEELFYKSEEILETACRKIKLTRGNTVAWAQLSQRLEDLAATMYLMSDDQLRSKMQAIVPQYSCPDYSATEGVRRLPHVEKHAAAQHVGA